MKLKSILAFLLLPLALMGAPTNLVDNIRVNTSFRFIPGAAAGRVLTSDLNGFGTWGVPIAGGDVFTTGVNTYNGSLSSNFYPAGARIGVNTNILRSTTWITHKSIMGQEDIIHTDLTATGSAFWRGYTGDFGTLIGNFGFGTLGPVIANRDAGGSVQIQAEDTVTKLRIALGLMTVGDGASYSVTFNNSTATTPNGLSWNSGQWNLRTTGNNSMSGKLSVGSDINPTTAVLQIAGTWTNFNSYADSGTYTRTSGNIQHFNISPTIVANGSAIGTTLRITPTLNIMSNMTSYQQLNIAPLTGTGTAGVTNSIALGRQIVMGGTQGAGVVIYSSFYGQQINNPAFSANVISNDFGLHIEDRTRGNTSRSALTIGTVTTSGNWGFYNNSIYTNYTAMPQFFGSLTAGNALKSMLAGTATLDFASTAAGGQESLPITVTGTVSGDANMIGVPFVSAAAGGAFTSFSSNDTVWVRFSNPTVGIVDPPSGTFSATTIRH